VALRASEWKEYVRQYGKMVVAGIAIIKKSAM
jgi:hypothetical protein